MTQLMDNTQVLEKAGANAGSSPPSPKQRQPWQNVSITDLEVDDGLLVTNVNQTQDLMRLKNKAVLFSGLKGTDDWIQVFRLENMHLTLEDLIKRGSVVLNASEETEQIEFTKETIHKFESELCAAIELYDKRIQWLLQGSRKMFGIIQGDKVGVLVDASDISFGPRLCDFKRDLLSLIDEQLCYLKQLYFISFGTEVSSLWQEPKAISVNILHEARQWVQQLKPSGSCNLLKALKKILLLQQLDTLVIIVGSCPDQSSETLSDYIQQCMPGRKLLIHTVAYECSSQVPAAVLKSIVEVVGGRYHCCSTKDENYDSSDIHLVLCERQKAKDLLSIVNDIYLGRMGDHLFSLVKSYSTESVMLSPASFLPRPPNHEGPLVIQIPNVFARNSAEWLKMNGLKAKKLSLYQVLAPNAFSPVEEFVPILQKVVSSTLHEKAMMPFEWHDGTVKNIHVDLPILFDYQKKLGRMVRVYERRIDWLSMASRRIWGTVYERSNVEMFPTVQVLDYFVRNSSWNIRFVDVVQRFLDVLEESHRVVILIDVSITNSMYIIHIQHSLRLLLEEQMSSKDAFNVIAFGSQVKAWQPAMFPPHPDNLQSVWRWALTLQCGGTRNVMNVLRRAVEVDFKDKDKYESQGLYLLTTGVPDQEMHAIRSYMTEVCRGCDLQLHVCLFSINGPPLDDYIPPRYASPKEAAIVFKEITQAANGRFHWFGETGIYESDDINIIASEMEKAVYYSHKCALLVESLKQRSGNHLAPEDLGKKEKNIPQKLPPPRPTALSLARMSQRISYDTDRRGTTKALMWRPTSSKAEIPPAQPIRNKLQASRKKTQKSKKCPEVSLSLFYTDKGKNVGAIYKKYSYPKCTKKSIPFVVLPQEEERCSSKEWLSKFSIKKLKLELSRLLLGPECVHQKQRVDSLHKKVSAKYCNIFPSVEMDGIEKHLQVQPKDLDKYIEQMEKVLQCYIRRLQWLLSGSRRLFGVILEANICILIDTSGSMEPSLEEVTKELSCLIWEQLRKNNIKFNLISFADGIKIWQESLVEATDEACHDAVQWVSMLRAHGNTSVLKALQRAFCLQGVEALYVLSDGKPDTSRTLVLQEIEMLLKKRAIKIHTISFNCSDRGANDFLRKLACQSGGRYHRCHGAVDGQLAAYKMLTEGFKDENDPVFPLFEGDDLKKLAEEVAKARNYLMKARFFRSLLQKKSCKQKDSCFS